jgi:hypothetical protein
MIITKLKFGLTKNISNYESARVDLEADIEPWEELEPTMRRLKMLAVDQIGVDSHQEVRSISGEDSELKKELSALLSNVRLKRSKVESLKREALELDQEVQKLIKFKELVAILTPQMQQVTNASENFYVYMGSTAHNLDCLEVIWSGIVPPQEGEPVSPSDGVDEECDPIPFDHATADCGSNHLIKYDEF